MARAPALYRGTSMKNKLASLLEAEREFREPVLADFGQASVDDVQAASGLAWLDIDYDARLSRLLVEHHGAEGGRRIAHECVVRNFRGTLLGPLVRAAVRLFAKDPGRGFLWVPRGWGQMFRNAGEVNVEHAPSSGEARIRVTDACDAFFGIGYADGLCGGLEAIFTITDTEGSVTVELADESERELVLICRW